MKFTIIAIDPGPEETAILVFENGKILDGQIEDNQAALSLVRRYAQARFPFTGWEEVLTRPVFVCEWLACYGMPVGQETFHAARWIGHFENEAWNQRCNFYLITRPEVKLQICKSARAKDANIRQALIDRFPATGGGKVPQIGTKGQPGPLYGIKSHLWSALAVAVAWTEIQAEQKQSLAPLPYEDAGQ